MDGIAIRGWNSGSEQPIAGVWQAQHGLSFLLSFRLSAIAKALSPTLVPIRFAIVSNGVPALLNFNNRSERFTWFAHDACSGLRLPGTLPGTVPEIFVAVMRTSCLKSFVSRRHLQLSQSFLWAKEHSRIVMRMSEELFRNHVDGGIYATSAPGSHSQLAPSNIVSIHNAQPAPELIDTTSLGQSSSSPIHIPQFISKDLSSFRHLFDRPILQSIDSSTKSDTSYSGTSPPSYSKWKRSFKRKTKKSNAEDPYTGRPSREYHKRRKYDITRDSDSTSFKYKYKLISDLLPKPSGNTTDLALPLRPTPGVNQNGYSVDYQSEGTRPHRTGDNVSNRHSSPMVGAVLTPNEQIQKHQIHRIEPDLDESLNLELPSTSLQPDNELEEIYFANESNENNKR